MDEALADGVPGCQAGRAFLNVDHRGRVSKCVEFRRPEDRAGDLGQDDVPGVLQRLRAAAAPQQCRACWYGSRGEVEGLYTVARAAALAALLVRHEARSLVVALSALALAGLGGDAARRSAGSAGRSAGEDAERPAERRCSPGSSASRR